MDERFGQVKAGGNDLQDIGQHARAFATTGAFAGSMLGGDFGECDDLQR